MAKEKKSHKEGKKRDSNSAAAYKSGSRRYFNKLKKVKRHAKHNNDSNARAWLTGANKILAMEYVRGSETVRKLHEAHFAMR